MWASPAVSLRSTSPVQFPRTRFNVATLVKLTGLTVVSVFIHGYHLGVEDQAIYLPAILKHLDASLFPRDAFFFESQTRLMLLDSIVAGIVRATGIPLAWVALGFHVLTIFLLLLASWRILRRCFVSEPAIWSGLALLMCMLTLPIAGTAQYIVDQYLHPRALATALVLMPIAELLPGVRRSVARTAAWCGLWFALAVAIHFQIAVFGLCLWTVLSFPSDKKRRVIEWERPAAAAAFLPLLLRVSPAWLEAARTRSQHYLLRWEWYEWLGIIAPMFLLWWFGAIARKRGLKTAAWLSRRMAIFGAVALVGGAALVLPPQFERLTPLQPMRVFILVYIFMFLLGGGLLGQFVLRRKTWRWPAVFLPMGFGMFLAAQSLFPASPHIELPGHVFHNDWTDAFLWARSNTPKDAFFALNPKYLSEDGEDYHGFRAWAWRSQMADLDKDPGTVSLVPSLAPEWQRQVHALAGWNQFTAKDFSRLQQEFGVSWVIVERRLPSGEERKVPENLDCPYQNSSLNVCTIR